MHALAIVQLSIGDVLKHVTSLGLGDHNLLDLVGREIDVDEVRECHLRAGRLPIGLARIGQSTNQKGDEAQVFPAGAPAARLHEELVELIASSGLRFLFGDFLLLF